MANVTRRGFMQAAIGVAAAVPVVPLLAEPLRVVVNKTRSVGKSTDYLGDFWLVRPGSANFPQDGRTCETAFASLQRAVDVAGRGDVIILITEPDQPDALIEWPPDHPARLAEAQLL